MAPSPPSSEPPRSDPESAWEAFYRDYRKPGFVPGYEITSKLGGGMFGLVFRARKQSIGRDYAIKFLKVDDPDVRRAIRAELDSVRHFAQVDHPNLVSIEDRGEVGGLPYIVMAYAGDRTLRDAIDAGEPAERCLAYVLQACRGVQALHDHSLVHFDLKPANVFLHGDVARVGDYGLSKLVAQSRNTMSMGRGTPYYMAPEMLQGRGDARSDIYSLGIMLFECAAGTLPFRGDSEWEVLRQHEEAEPEFPPQVPPQQAAVLRRCLAKDPNQRYQSVDALLAAFLDGVDPNRCEVPPPASGPEDAAPVDDGEASDHARELADSARVLAREAMVAARAVMHGVRGSVPNAARLKEAAHAFGGRARVAGEKVAASAVRTARRCARHPQTRLGLSKLASGAPWKAWCEGRAERRARRAEARVAARSRRRRRFATLASFALVFAVFVFVVDQRDRSRKQKFVGGALSGAHARAIASIAELQLAGMGEQQRIDPSQVRRAVADVSEWARTEPPPALDSVLRSHGAAGVVAAQAALEQLDPAAAGVLARAELLAAFLRERLAIQTSDHDPLADGGRSIADRLADSAWVWRQALLESAADPTAFLWMRQRALAPAAVEIRKR